jgi:hypothetical protein
MFCAVVEHLYILILSAICICACFFFCIISSLLDLSV